jgi:hypothetical protein
VSKHSAKHNGNVRRFVVYTSHDRLQLDLLNVLLWDVISYSVTNKLLYKASVRQYTRCHVSQCIIFSLLNLITSNINNQSTPIHADQLKFRVQISGFSHGTGDVFILQSCSAVYIGSSLATFRNSLIRNENMRCVTTPKSEDLKKSRDSCVIRVRYIARIGQTISLHGTSPRKRLRWSSW